MNITFSKLVLTIGSFLLFCVTPCLQAAVVVSEPNYYIRPALRVDLGELIDGIEENGRTVNIMRQGVLGYSESEVNLNEGTVKMYAEYFGGSNTGHLQTFGGFGERITITGGAGTYWDFSFGIDGYLDVEAGGPINDAVDPAAFFYNAGMAIYSVEYGPGEIFYNNFIPGFNDYDPAFFAQDDVIDSIDTESEFSFYDLFAQVSGSILLESDYEVFDIFTFSNFVVNSEIGDGLESFVADLTNTARYEHTFEDGVDAFSSSGSFLGLNAPPSPPVNQVSAPGLISLVSLAGLCLLTGRRLRVMY